MSAVKLVSLGHSKLLLKVFGPQLEWEHLLKLMAYIFSVLSVSLSMEECEALCTRLAIMVNGQFKCLGSTQHLKNKFGEGYTLMAKIREREDIDVFEKTEALKKFIEKTFPGSVLKDAHFGYVHYQISNANVSWSQLFGTIERAREEYYIEDYSVSQTTLEQVFLNFAKKQLPPREMETKSCGVKVRSCCRKMCCCCCSEKDNNTVHCTHF